MDSASTTPVSSASVAAVRWFDLLANDAPPEVFEEVDVPLGLEGGFLDPSDGQGEDAMTPLQRATRIIDGQPPARNVPEDGITPPAASQPMNLAEESLWKAPENICLLDRERGLFENFLLRICSWVGFSLRIRTHTPYSL